MPALTISGSLVAHTNIYSSLAATTKFILREVYSTKTNESTIRKKKLKLLENRLHPRRKPPAAPPPTREKSRLFSQETINQALEVLQRSLMVQHQFALVEEAGAEPTLDRFAEDDIFFLHLINEADKVFLVLSGHGIHEAVIEDRERFVGLNRQKEVEGEIARPGIEIEGKVGPEIGIEAIHRYTKHLSPSLAV
jgi:hypothetical protein